MTFALFNANYQPAIANKVVFPVAISIIDGFPRTHIDDYRLFAGDVGLIHPYACNGVYQWPEQTTCLQAAPCWDACRLF